MTAAEPHVIVGSATKMYFVSPSNRLQTSAWSDKLHRPRSDWNHRGISPPWSGRYLMLMNVANLHHIKQQKLNRSCQNFWRRDAWLVHLVHQRIHQPEMLTK